MSKLSCTLKAMFTPGTPLCALTYATIGAIVALLLLFIGFWKTLFVLLLAAIGAFLGGTNNKRETVSNVINKLFPPKDQLIKMDANDEDKE